MISIEPLDDIYADDTDDTDDIDTQSADDLLTALLNDPLIAAEARRMLTPNNPPRKDVVHGGSCKTYTTVTQHIHCLNCGHTTVCTTKLSPKDTITVSKKNGDSITYHFKIIPNTGVITSYCTSCDACAHVIKTWSRDELEYEYLSLLRECGATAMFHLQCNRRPRFTDIIHDAL